MDSSDQIPGDVDYPTDTEFTGSESGHSDNAYSEMTTEVGSLPDEDVNSEEGGYALSLPDEKETELSPLARVLLDEALRMNQLRRMPEPEPQKEAVEENHPWVGPIEPFLAPNPRDKEGFPKLSRKERELLEQGKDISSSIPVTFGPRYFDLHTGPHSLDDTHVPMHVLDDGRVSFGHNVDLEEVKEGSKWKSPIEEEGETWTALLEGDDDERIASSVTQSEDVQDQKDDDDDEFWS